MPTLQEQAKQWATDALMFDADFTAKIHGYIGQEPAPSNGAGLRLVREPHS